jgi:hypothetical protein
MLTGFVRHPFAGAPGATVRQVARICSWLACSDAFRLALHLYLLRFLNGAAQWALVLMMCLQLAILADEIRVCEGTAGIPVVNGKLPR